MARVEGVQRERRPHRWNLEQVVQSRNRAVLRIGAPLGIVGCPGTGRKTLAYRLGRIGEGTFEQEVPLAYFYLQYFESELSPEESPRYRKYCLKLFVYIIDEPRELPLHIPALYWQYWNDFCCLIFVYDVGCMISLHYLYLCLFFLNGYNFRIPTIFVVGNKLDRRQEEQLNGNHLVPRVFAEEIAALYAASAYFECSAKYNINVIPIVRSIIELIEDDI